MKMPSDQFEADQPPPNRPSKPAKLARKWTNLYPQDKNAAEIRIKEAFVRPTPALQQPCDRQQWDQWKQFIGLGLGVLLVAVPCFAIYAMDTFWWSLSGCKFRPDSDLNCPCGRASTGALTLAYRAFWFQGAVMCLLVGVWGSACGFNWHKQAALTFGLALGFALIAFFTADDGMVYGVGFSAFGFGVCPLVGTISLGSFRAGGHAALPVMVLVVYIGLVQVVLVQLFPALPDDKRGLFVTVFPLIISGLQRLARKALSRLPCLRSRNEWTAGRWPKQNVVALAAIFFAFGETLNLAVLVTGSSFSLEAVLSNLFLRLATGVNGRVCLLWRAKRYIARGLGRSLSLNPFKFGRQVPPEVLGPKVRNRVSAIFLGNRYMSGYSTLLAWLLYEVFQISFVNNLAADPCNSLTVIGSCRPSRHWWLLGSLLACELLEDMIVKAFHTCLLPCVTRTVLAPSWSWLALQCSCQILFALNGFESAGSLLRLTLSPMNGTMAI